MNEDEKNESQTPVPGPNRGDETNARGNARQAREKKFILKNEETAEDRGSRKASEIAAYCAAAADPGETQAKAFSWRASALHAILSTRCFPNPSKLH